MQTYMQQVDNIELQNAVEEMLIRARQDPYIQANSKHEAAVALLRKYEGFLAQRISNQMHLI